MRKAWQWLLDKKSNTLKKWRSSNLRTDEESTDSFSKKNGKKSHSTSSLSSTYSKKHADFENFFEEPEVKNLLEKRRESFRASPSADLFPVLPPDVEAGIEKKSPRSTPKPTRTKQLRFSIPEVEVSFEREEPRRVSFCIPTTTTTTTTVPSSPLPPEIDWSQPSSSPLTTIPETMPVEAAAAVPAECHATLSFDDEVTVSTRRMTANEKARQNLIAQRRQSNVQLVQAITGRRTSTTLIPLTCAQIHLIRSLWRQVYTTKGPTVIGTSIYHRLCFKNQSVKEQMKRVPLPPKFQNHDTFIKAHSKAVAELVDQIVENLDDLDGIVEELARIGRVHAKLLQGELSGKFWNTVAETIIDCTLEWGDRRCRSETVRKAWALIVAFAIEKIKMGHHEQRKLMLNTRQSLPALNIPIGSLKL